MSISWKSFIGAVLLACGLTSMPSLAFADPLWQPSDFQEPDCFNTAGMQPGAFVVDTGSLAEETPEVRQAEFANVKNGFSTTAAQPVSDDGISLVYLQAPGNLIGSGLTDLHNAFEEAFASGAIVSVSCVPIKKASP